jgi:membrane-bound lytic murein transglycosylase B
MSSIRLLLIACLAVRIWAAENGSGTADPFAAYHQAIESHLSSILQHSQAQPQEVREGVPIEQNTVSNESKASEIKAFARRFWGGREAELTAALDRLQRFRPTLEPILDIEGVPRELVAGVLIESGAKPLAISSRQARGLWQFIPKTARQYGLKVSEGKDERVYVEAATRAAAHYLRDLHSHFGDWPLALAAYNAGQKAVESALEKGRASTFWQLNSAGLLPPETRSYVPAVLAAMQLLGSTQPTTPAGGRSQRDDWVYASAHVVN